MQDKKCLHHNYLHSKQQQFYLLQAHLYLLTLLVLKHLVLELVEELLDKDVKKEVIMLQ